VSRTANSRHTATAPAVLTLDAFPDLAALHAANPVRYPYLLESVAHDTPRARYDILFAFPGETLELSGTDVHAGGFLERFDAAWRREALPAGEYVELPFTGGWFVYLGYELASEIEPALGKSATDSAFPVALATRIPAAVIRDHAARRTLLVAEAGMEHLLEQMKADVSGTPEFRAMVFNVRRADEEAPEQFLEGVRRVLEYIRAGDVFQVNLSRRWQIELDAGIAPVAVYHRLRAANPAPFAGLMTLPGQRAVISSSPERLVSVRRGHVSTRPIAGTYPRGDDVASDARLAAELLRHPKERAEHVMLIDLERNDLGRVCRPGSVRVNELMTLETYRHVHHIVSEVTGELREDVTPGHVLRAVFPGGTITGCPKVRCMQIIRELERAARAAYTGSMGYINRDGSMDLNILIRTLVQDGNTMYLRAGAGIVADSNPERELAETRAKARGLLVALGLDT
jgi:anthranilate synthase component 1